jgi:hypothetical protein
MAHAQFSVREIREQRDNYVAQACRAMTNGALFDAIGGDAEMNHALRASWRAIYLLRGGGTIPSCCNMLIWSSRVQLSVIWPFSIRAKIIPWTTIGLLVGKLPRNSPVCVPRIVQCAATLSPALISSSTAQWRSGKAERNMAINCLSPSRVCGMPQLGVWVTPLGATSSFTTAKRPWLKACSTIRRMNESVRSADTYNLVRTIDRVSFS